MTKRPIHTWPLNDLVGLIGAVIPVGCQARHALIVLVDRLAEVEAQLEEMNGAYDSLYEEIEDLRNEYGGDFA